MEPPPEEEQQRILARLHPQLAPLLPHAMDTLSLVRAAYGQQHQQQLQSEAVAAALASSGIGSGAGNAFGFSVGRHFSIRDVLKWCRRMGSVRERACRQQQQSALPCSATAEADLTPGRLLPPALLTPAGLPLLLVACLQLHCALLQRALKPGRSVQYQASVAAVPVAVREAAFVEAADCFCALLGRAEVRGEAFGC